MVAHLFISSPISASQIPTLDYAKAKARRGRVALKALRAKSANTIAKFANFWSGRVREPLLPSYSNLRDSNESSPKRKTAAARVRTAAECIKETLTSLTALLDPR